jgi:hypothetical protein
LATISPNNGRCRWEPQKKHAAMRNATNTPVTLTIIAGSGSDTRKQSLFVQYMHRERLTTVLRYSEFRR